ncbi:hypothetical protein ADEAN_000087200 [Angomonas deanei]|uniref:Uncharacterized protein n=1 Tax=Angomonas deanei TaxID=59799 RepID=A0A7G2C2K5_9TRYP|nr:hypothetical protein ADEAN_000087200 [Angomonas deanei]
MSNYDESFESVTTSGSSSSSNSAEEEVPKKVVEAPMVPVAVAAPVPMPVLPVELPQSPKVTLPPPIPVPTTAGGTGEAESAHASPLMDGSSQSNSKTEASTSVASSGQPEFKYLSNFVAFGSQSQSARSSQQMPRAESESYANNTEETGTDKSPFHSQKPSIPSVQAPPPVTPAIPTPPVVTKDEEQSGKVDDSSSVFSTLSQNVKFKSPMAETLAPKEMEAGRAQYTPPPVLADSPPPPTGADHSGNERNGAAQAHPHHAGGTQEGLYLRGAQGGTAVYLHLGPSAAAAVVVTPTARCHF